MKRLEVLSIACALLSGACSFAFGELTFQELGKGSDHRIVVANDLLEVQFEPRRGGGIRHLIGKTDGFDRVHSQNRFLLDMFMRQPYPGEMQEANYEFEIIDERPRRVGVRMRRTAAVSPHDGIRLFKTVWINSGSRSLTAAYQFLNASAAYRSFSYWTQHFAVAGESEVNDRYVRPATDRLLFHFPAETAISMWSNGRPPAGRRSSTPSNRSEPHLFSTSTTSGGFTTHFPRQPSSGLPTRSRSARANPGQRSFSSSRFQDLIVLPLHPTGSWRIPWWIAGMAAFVSGIG